MPEEVSSIILDHQSISDQPNTANQPAKPTQPTHYTMWHGLRAGPYVNRPMRTEHGNNGLHYVAWALAPAHHLSRELLPHLYIAPGRGENEALHWEDNIEKLVILSVVSIANLVETASGHPRPQWLLQALTHGCRSVRIERCAPTPWSVSEIFPGA